MNVGRPLPAIPIWPVKHSEAKLREAQTDPFTFSHGYRMESVTPGERKFPSFEKCIQTGLTAAELAARRMPVYVGVDLAGKKRKGNAIVAIGLDSNLRRCPVEIRAGAWSSPETARNLAEVVSNHDVRFVQVENNAYQQALIDWIKESKYDFWMKIEAFTTGSNKGDLEVGLPALEVEFHNEAWIIPGAEFEGHPPACACDWCGFVTEFKNYPKGATTDKIMATWIGRDAASKWAPKRSTPFKGRNFSRR